MTLANSGGSTSSARCQMESSRAVRSSAKMPRSTIAPVCSARGMKSAGPRRPRRGMVPPQQRLEPGDGAIFQPDDRAGSRLSSRRGRAHAAQVGFEIDCGRRAALRIGGPEQFEAVAAGAFLALRIAISPSFSMSSRREMDLAGRNSATPIEAVSGTSRSPKVTGVETVRLHRVGPARSISVRVRSPR